MRAGRAERVGFFSGEDHQGGNSCAGVHHALRQDVQSVPYWQVQRQAGSDARKRRHALLEQLLYPRPLGDILRNDAQGFPTIEEDHTPAGLDVYQRALFATILPLAHIVVLSFPNMPHGSVDARPIVSDDVVERHVPKFFLRVAECFLKSGVGFQDALGLSVDQTYVLRGQLDHRAVELLALLERLLGPLTLGDVTDCGHPYGMSLVSKHLPPNLPLEGSAVLSQANGVVGFFEPGRPGASHQSLIFGRVKVCGGHADNLRGLVPEHGGEGCVRLDYLPVLGDGYAFEGSLRQPFEAFLALFKLFLGPLALGNVAGRGEDQALPSVVYEAHADLEREGSIVLTPEIVLAEAHDLPWAAAHGAFPKRLALPRPLLFLGDQVGSNVPYV